MVHFAALMISYSALHNYVFIHDKTAIKNLKSVVLVDSTHMERTVSQI